MARSLPGAALFCCPGLARQPGNANLPFDLGVPSLG